MVIKNMGILLPLAAALVPLALFPGWSFYFDITPKTVILLLLTAAALILWDGSLVWGRIPALFAIQIAWLAVASALSRNPALSFNGSNWRRFGLVTYATVLLYGLLVIRDVAGDTNRIVTYLRAATVASIPAGLYGIAQYFGYDPLLNSPDYHAGEGIFTIVRPPSTLGHASYFGVYLVYIAFMAVALFCASPASRPWRLTAAAAAAIAFLAAVLSGTRGALLGMIVGFVLLAFRLPAAGHRTAIWAATAVGASLALFCISPGGAALRSRIHWSLEEPAGGARPRLWRDTLEMSSKRMLTGYGPETFAAQFPRFESLALARAFPDFEHESPHNAFLDALVSQGIPGLILLAATAGLALWIGLSTDGALPILLSAGLAGGVVAQMFTSFTVPTALFLYLTVALIAGVAGQGTLSRVRWIWRIPAYAAALLLVIWAGRLEFSDYRLAQVRQALARDDFCGAVSEYEKARRWYPAGSSADLYFSRELANLFRRTRDARLKLQIWTPAFQCAARAASTSENPSGAFYNLAFFFATQNDVPDVERSLRTAIAWAPRWFKPHWALSQLLGKEGFTPEAWEEAERARELNGKRELP